jgi:hypothetical protein
MAAVDVSRDSFSAWDWPAGQRIDQTCGLASERIRVLNSRLAAAPSLAAGVFVWTEVAFAAGRTAVRSVLSAVRVLVTMEAVMGTSGVG